MLHYTVEDGLPSNCIYQVYKDKKGFLWIGTDKGVAKYNGIKFENYTTYDGLADNEVLSFLEDYYGRLWFASYNGGLCFFQNGTFHSAANTAFLSIPIKTSFIKGINLSADSSVTINVYNPRILLNIGKDQSHIIHINNIGKNINLEVVHYKNKLRDGQYILATDSSNILIDTQGNIKEVIRRKSCLGCRSTYSQDKKYFLDKSFVYAEDMKVIRPLNKGIFHGNIVRIYYEDSLNWFWLTNHGLFLNDSICILRGNDITSITQDVLGNYWVGTLNAGLYCFRNDFKSTTVHKNVYEGKVSYCYSDDSHIFFTVTNNDLLMFSNGKVSTLFDYEKIKKAKSPLTYDFGYLIERKNDTYNYYNLYNEDNISIHNVLSRKPAIFRRKNIYTFMSVKSLYADGNDMYIKTWSKILRVDNWGSTITNNIKSTYSPDTNSGYRIFGMAKAADRSIYYTTINGVYKIENGISKIQQQFSRLSLKNLEIYGKYLLGITQDNRLVICNNITGEMEINYVTGQDCIWNKFFKINDTDILVSTNNLYRIIRLYPSSTKTKYSVFIVENPFIPLSAEDICVDTSGCYFFKNGSITRINAPDFFLKPAPPRLFFSMLKTKNKTYVINGYLQLTFTEAENLRISFSTLSFASKDVSYQYSFSKGDENNWIDIKNAEITLVKPGYGVFILKVRAKTITSNYCTPIVFTLRIKKPYWATWWFAVLCICSGLTLSIIIIRYRILYTLHKKDQKHKDEIKFLKSEYKALNALMNPHFIFNTLHNLQSLFNSDKVVSANNYLWTFSKLIRQNMHNISKEMITLQAEIELVKDYLALEKLRFEDKLTYAFNIDETVNLTSIIVPPLLIQPLVENAIKHGILPMESGSGLIVINIYTQQSVLYIEVKDNGVGLARSRQHTRASHESYGLENIKKRIEQLSFIQNKKISFLIKELKNEAGNHLWTVVIIGIPLP